MVKKGGIPVKTSRGYEDTVKEIRGFKIKNFVPEDHIGTSESNMSPTIIVNGKRRSGKSIFVRWLLGHLGSFPTAYSVVTTGRLDKTIVNCFPPPFREYELSEENLAKNFAIQKEKVEAFKKGKLVNVSRSRDVRHLYVLDDCISEKKIIRNSKTLTTLMLEGRHYMSTLILTTQDINAPTPAMRQNFDWIFLLRTISKVQLMSYYKYYANFFDTFELFKEVFDEITKDFGVMVINNQDHSGDLSNVVFRARADDTERPRLGAPIFWDKDYVAKLRHKKHKKEHKELKKQDTAVPVTTVHKKVGYRIEYPPSRSEGSGSGSRDHEILRPKVSFSDAVRRDGY